MARAKRWLDAAVKKALQQKRERTLILQKEEECRTRSRKQLSVRFFFVEPHSYQTLTTALTSRATLNSNQDISSLED